MTTRALTQAMLVAAILAPLSAAMAAAPLLSAPYTDHAVFQRDREIVIRGEASPGAVVAVEFDNETVHAKADGGGAWRASLAARPAGGPFEMKLSAGGVTQTIRDILIGDVYLCSGQSNMEFALRYATNAEAFIGGAADADIRLLKIPRASSTAPRKDIDAPEGWRRATPQAASDFSALCFLFGKEIKAAEKTPVGLIEAAWGGTRIEAWMSRGALERLGGFRDELKSIERARTDPGRERRRWLASLNRWWTDEEPGGRAGFARAVFDDANWPQITLGGPWEQAGAPALADFDGAVWFRKSITLSAREAQEAIALELGPIDDIDATYVNGVLIGATDIWDAPRVYKVPADLLREGDNLIAVGVLDTGGGGGLWGPEGAVKVHYADGSATPLSGPWRYMISAPLGDLRPPRRIEFEGPHALSALHNAMIAPLAPYALKGVLWYQGEANARYPDEYRRLLPAFIADWRRTFGADDLPFILAQLAAFGAPPTAPERASWGGIREAQRRVAQADENVGLAVAIDIGDPFDIHPSQKAVLARRMALIARRMIYGRNVDDQGPGVASAVRDPQGVIIAFDSGPLLTRSSSRPIAFELCTEDRTCRFVDASIDGNAVRLAPVSESDAFIRYCWGNAPICNLVDDSGLPAVPFEIDIR